MQKLFGTKNYHFKESENRPNSEKILKTLTENGLLELNFNFSEWRIHTDDIIQQLRKYNSELINDKYLDKPVEFTLELKNKLSDKIESNPLDNIIETLIINGVNDTKRKIQKIFRYNSLYEVLKKILSDSISKSIHLSDANIAILNDSSILDLHKKIFDLFRRLDRLNEYLNSDLNDYQRYQRGNISENKKITEMFEKVFKSTKIIDKLEALQEIVNYENTNNEYKNNIPLSERFLYEISRIFDIKTKHSSALRFINLKEEFEKNIEKINSSLEGINDENLQENLTILETNTEIKFSLYLSEFIPAFISRIDIIEISETNKNKFIETFEKRKNSKDYLALGYLTISIFIFLFILQINLEIYNDNISSTKTINDFIINFLGHNIYLFSVEIILLILAFYFLGLFRTYSKVVELYDSHILLIESDFYFRDDKDLNTSGIHTFELRKENTQKIHSLPDRTFEMLNGKHEIKTEAPMSKILEKIGDILEKALSSEKK